MTPEDTPPIQSVIDKPISVGRDGFSADGNTLHDHAPPSPDGTMRVLKDSWGITLSDFRLRQKDDQRGQGTGLRMGADGSVPGTQCGAGEVRQVALDGYEIGLHVGDRWTKTAASEIRFTTLRLDDCTIGAFLEAPNTLNLQFPNLNVAGCWVGVHATNAHCITVDCGSASGWVDGENPKRISKLFDMGHAHQCRILGMRAEHLGVPGLAGCFFTHGTTKASQIILISGCTVAQSVDPAKAAIRLLWGANATVEHSTFDGVPVEYEAVADDHAEGYGSVAMVNVKTQADRLIVSPNPGNCMVRIRNCWQIDAAGDLVKRFPDRTIRLDKYLKS